MAQSTMHGYDWIGRSVVDSDGAKIGKISNIYLDQQTEQPEWLSLESGVFGRHIGFVPLEGASPGGDDVVVAWDKAHVKDAPRCDPNGYLTPEDEARLYQHYGLAYTEPSFEARAQGTTRQGGTGDRSDRGTDDAMTRSEEELHVGTERKSAERVRLKKYVVTEQVQQTVPVQREEVRVEREPITEENIDAALRGADISEAEHEETLMADELVIEKRIVPKERVRLAKDSVTEEREVDEQIRKERIDVDRGRAR